MKDKILYNLLYGCMCVCVCIFKANSYQQRVEWKLPEPAQGERRDF